MGVGREASAKGLGHYEVIYIPYMNFEHTHIYMMKKTETESGMLPTNCRVRTKEVGGQGGRSELQLCS